MNTLLLLTLLGLQSTAHAEYDPTQILFDAFSSDCSTGSDLTRKAQSQSALLTNIAKGFRDDPACKALVPNMDALTSSLNAQNANYTAAQLQNQLNKDLLIKLQIGLASEKALPLGDQNADFIAASTSRIASLRIEIAEADSKPSMAARMNEIAMVDTARISANSLTSSLMANKACMVAQPSAFGQVLGAVLRIASGIVPGLYGAGISGAASVVDNIVAGANNTKMVNFVKGMRSEALNQSVGCALEGLAETYCQGRDVEGIIRQFKAEENQLECNQGITGARIAGQEINSLMDFLQKVSLTEGRQTDKLASKQLTSDRDVLETALLAKIETARLNLKKGDSEAVVIDGLIDDLWTAIGLASGRLSGSSGSAASSIAQSGFEAYASSSSDINFIKFNSSTMFVNAKNCGIWRYLYTGGAKGSKADGDDTGDFNSAGNANFGKDTCISAFKKAGFAEPKIDDLEKAVKAYSGKLDAFVVTKLNTIQATDANTVLAGADKKSGKRMTPLEVLGGIENYLRGTQADLKPSNIADNYLRDAIEPVLKKVVDAQALYNDPSLTDPKEKASKIYEVFGKDDYTLFSVQYFEVVKMDMERRRTKNKDEYTGMLFALSGQEAANTMQRYLGFTDHDIAGSIAARASSENSLKQFAKLFADPVSTAMRDYAGKSDRVSRQMLGMTCMRMLLVPRPEETIPAVSEVCGGTSYNAGSLGPLNFNDWARKPFTSRVCSIYDYFRKAEIASRIGYDPKRAPSQPPQPYRSTRPRPVPAK